MGENAGIHQWIVRVLWLLFALSAIVQVALWTLLILRGCDG